MNIHCIAGNVGTVRNGTTSGGMSWLNFSVATEHYKKSDDGNGEKETTWHSVALFGKRADGLRPYIKAGLKVAVSGPVFEKKNTDENGIERTSRTIFANEVTLQGAPQGKGSKEQAGEKAPVDDDDIPF